MGKILRRAFCLVMAAVMIFISGIETVFAAESEEQSLEEIIRPQIEAFAKSIDQKDANGKAADALANHGIIKNGEKLVVGEKHALTATLLNSELMKYVLTIALSETFELVQNSDEIKIGYLACGYYDSAWYDYKIYRSKERIKYVWHEKYSGAYSSYDESLEWLGGTLECDIEMKLSEIAADKIIYDIDVVIFDRFDFNTENESALKNLLGIIGALLFTPFNWNATADFQIEIPNDCEHSFGEWKTAAEADCTENGREERICINCGCTETKETAALGHSFGEWSETKAPTYFEEGEERRTCSNCGQTETRAVETLEFFLGDVNGDEKINVLDANIVRKYAAKSAELSEKQFAAADVNGDGSVNVLDANLIRKYSAKLITVFPVEE